jgi:hypothetical protein
MNKLILLIAGLLGLGASVSYEHLDFRPEISTGITKTVMTGDETPVNPDEPVDECPCNKNTGIITHGDGHTSKCPCDNGECGCVNKPSEPAPPEQEDCNQNTSSSRKGLLQRIFGR